MKFKRELRQSQRIDQAGGMGLLGRIGAVALAMVMLAGCGVQKDVDSTEPGMTGSQDMEIPGSTEESTVEATEVPTEPVIEDGAGVSVLDFLTVATEPVGSTMYIWGGGWNEEDTGAGIEAVTPGISSRWAEFAAQQNSSYDYKNHRYQIHDGLDCSGYVGWAVYNILETESGQEGYVGKAAGMAEDLARRGLGEYIPAEQLDRWLPGDIMSMKGHVWICVGMCDDGSVLLLHASPPGVIFSGTSLSDGSGSQATALATKIMKEHYPDWYRRYPNSDRPHSYLEQSSAMRWSTQVLQDQEGLRQLSAEEVVERLFS